MYVLLRLTMSNLMTLGILFQDIEEEENRLREYQESQQAQGIIHAPEDARMYVSVIILDICNC